MNTGHLSVGSSSFFCAYLLAGLLKRFKNKYPGVSVEIHEGNIRELRAGLLDDSIDLLLETAIPAGDEVERYLYDYEQIILAVPAEFEVNKKLRSFQMARCTAGADAGIPGLSVYLFKRGKRYLYAQQGDLQECRF